MISSISYHKEEKSMTHFIDEFGNVYDDDDLPDFIADEVFDEDAFEEYLNDNEDRFEVCGYDYGAGETMRSAYPSDFETEHRNKIAEIAEEFRYNLENADLGDTVDVYNGYLVTVCDEDGNTSTKPVKNILLPAEYTIEGEEDKVLRFKAEDEEERFVVELPISIAKEIAKKILF